MDIDYEKLKLLAHCNPQIAEYLRSVQQNMGNGGSQRSNHPPGNSVTQNAGLHTFCQGLFEQNSSLQQNGGSPMQGIFQQNSSAQQHTGSAIQGMLGQSSGLQHTPSPMMQGMFEQGSGLQHIRSPMQGVFDQGSGLQHTPSPSQRVTEPRSGVQHNRSYMQGTSQLGGGIQHAPSPMQGTSIATSGLQHTPPPMQDGYLEQLAASHATNYISIKSRAEREKKKTDKFTIGTGREKPKKDTKSPGVNHYEELQIVTQVIEGTDSRLLPLTHEQNRAMKYGFYRDETVTYSVKDNALDIMRKCRSYHAPLLDHTSISSFGMLIRDGKGITRKLKPALDGEMARILDGHELKMLRNRTIFLTKLKEEEKFVPVVKKTGIMIVCPFVCKKEMDQNELDDHECSISEAGDEEMQFDEVSPKDELLVNPSTATPSLRKPPEENGLDGLLILHGDSLNDQVTPVTADPSLDEDIDRLLYGSSELNSASTLSSWSTCGTSQHPSVVNQNVSMQSFGTFNAPMAHPSLIMQHSHTIAQPLIAQYPQFSGQSATEHQATEYQATEHQSTEHQSTEHQSTEHQATEQQLFVANQQQPSSQLVEDSTMAHHTGRIAQQPPPLPQEIQQSQSAQRNDEECRNRGREKLILHVDFMMQDNKIADIVEDYNFLIVRRDSMLADFIAAYQTAEFKNKLLLRLVFKIEGEEGQDEGGVRRECLTTLMVCCEESLPYTLLAYEKPEKYLVEKADMYIRLKAFGCIAGLTIFQDLLCDPWVLKLVKKLQSEKDISHPFLKGLQDPFQLSSLIFSSSKVQSLFTPRAWSKEDLLKCFKRDPKDMKKDAHNVELGAIKDSVFDEFRRFLTDVIDGNVYITREGDMRPATGSDIFKFCTGSPNLSAQPRDNEVLVSFFTRLNAFRLPYACTCARLLQLPLTLRTGDLRKGWIMALEHGIVFGNP